MTVEEFIKTNPPYTAKEFSLLADTTRLWQRTVPGILAMSSNRLMSTCATLFEQQDAAAELLLPLLDKYRRPLRRGSGDGCRCSRCALRSALCGVGSVAVSAITAGTPLTIRPLMIAVVRNRTSTETESD